MNSCFLLITLQPFFCLFKFFFKKNFIFPKRRKHNTNFLQIPHIFSKGRYSPDVWAWENVILKKWFCQILLLTFKCRRNPINPSTLHYRISLIAKINFFSFFSNAALDKRGFCTFTFTIHPKTKIWSYWNNWIFFMETSCPGVPVISTVIFSVPEGSKSKFNWWSQILEDLEPVFISETCPFILKSMW